MRAKAKEGVAAFEAGDSEQALALIDEAKKQARAFRRSLKPFDPEKPDKGGVDLVAKTRYSLWDDLPPIDVFFMVFWGFVMTWPLWNPFLNRVVLARNRDRIRVWRRRKWLGVLAISALAAFGWYGVFGSGGNINQNSGYKHGMMDGALVAIDAGTKLSDKDNAFEPTWTPIRYGVAETHSEEKFRPPTWLASAKTDEEGRYVPKGGMTQDSQATEGGFQATYNPVELRPGEPDKDAWNRHIAGTDELGRDFFSRMIWGPAPV